MSFHTFALAAALAASSVLLSAAPESAAGPMIEGKADSQVRVDIFEDLQSANCANFRKMMDEILLPRFAGKVAFVHHDFPLPNHAWAKRGAIAARFFWRVRPALGVAFEKDLFSHMWEITPDNLNLRVAAFARGNGVDPANALLSMDDPKLVKLVNDDLDDGVARGITHLPTVLVNGVPFIETFRVEDVVKAIEAALKEQTK